MTNERFIELLVKELTGEITEGEKTELEILLSKDDSFAKQAELFKLYWKQNTTNKFNSQAVFNKVKAKIREKESTGEVDSNSDLVITELGETSSSKRRFFNYFLKVAASLILIAATYGIYQNYAGKIANRHENWQVKVTPRGVKSIFILTDGTRIVLNSGSKLGFPKQFNGDTREVTLTGEAFFDVHEDPKHPFIIHTDKMNIKVLGTAFNVKSYPNEKTSETTLIRGSIAVTVNKNPSERIILKPSQKLIIDNGEKKRQTKPELKKNSLVALTTITYFQNHDTTIVETSWVNNKLVFKNEEFASVAQKMERWYNVDFHFNKKNAQDLKFTGVFETETVDEALRALQLTENFNYKIEDSHITIY